MNRKKRKKVVEKERRRSRMQDFPGSLATALYCW